MADPPTRPPTPEARVRLLLLLEWALGLRVLAAVLVQWYARHREVLCLFPDTLIYWLLAGTIREGRPYEDLQWGENPHFALRTPGYPLFLAACRLAFGDRVMPVRLVQAILGAASVWLVYRLTAEVLPAGRRSRTIGRGWTIPLVAAALAAFDPFQVGTSALVLSEAVFIPLMLGSLWGLAALWPGPDAGEGGPSRPGRRWLRALGAGAASGAAVMVRPSWLLCVPALPAAWLGATLLRRDRDRRLIAGALGGAILFGVGAAAVMAPWWIRNARVYGRFVPTALWAGASLYDGLNPRADGSSAMDFLAAPEIWPLDEEAQDAELWRRAVAFARREPRRALELAAIKAGRYWSPWPNAEGFRSPAVAVLSTLCNGPLLAAIALGVWDRRRDVRALALLAGPLAYFAALHLAFASSMRYRIPAEAPALGLAAIGIARLFGKATDRASRPVATPGSPTVGDGGPG